MKSNKLRAQEHYPEHSSTVLHAAAYLLIAWFIEERKRIAVIQTTNEQKTDEGTLATHNER